MHTAVISLEISAFIASLIAWPYLKNINHLKWFPLLLFIIAFVEGSQYFFRQYFPYFTSSFYNIQVPIQHLIYMLILFYAIGNEVKRRLLVYSMAGFIIITILTLIFFTQQNRFNVLSYCAGSLIIICWILILFYDMLKRPSGFNFLRAPFFYMLFAFLLFNVGTLPYFLMLNWLYFVQKYKEITNIFISVSGILNCILYGTYTIVFLWMSLKKEHS